MKKLFISILLLGLMAYPVQAEEAITDEDKMNEIKMDEGTSTQVEPSPPDDPADIRAREEKAINGDEVTSNLDEPQSADDLPVSADDIVRTTGGSLIEEDAAAEKATGATDDPNLMVIMSAGIASMTLCILGAYVLIHKKKR